MEAKVCRYFLSFLEINSNYDFPNGLDQLFFVSGISEFFDSSLCRKWAKK